MKRFIAMLFALLLALNLCACDVNAPTTDPTETTVVTTPTDTTVVTDPTGTTDVTEPVDTTGPTTDTTISTDPSWHLQSTADKLAGYAIDFNWNDSVVTIILTVGLPDLDMLDRVEKEDDTTFDLYLTDGTSYEVVLDAKTGEVTSIHNNVDSPTENDSYYKG